MFCERKWGLLMNKILKSELKCQSEGPMLAKSFRAYRLETGDISLVQDRSIAVRSIRIANRITLTRVI
jgi:hypothetical protein